MKPPSSHSGVNSGLGSHGYGLLRSWSGDFL
uniref:Uncharacterized protein n=1 Tax=Anguilla anguilla TaxID=7936 RepID=A0A0E9R8D6_ANGAN